MATAALIGMAAMFAGASRALLTSVVFALETTGQSNGLLPLLGACVAAYFVSFFFMEGSIMTEKIKRRGVLTPDSYEPDVLQGVLVRQLLVPVPPSDSMLFSDNVLLSDKMGMPSLYATDDVGFAAEMMGKFNTDRLLVLEGKDKAKVSGVITSAAILAYYSRLKQKEHRYDSPGRTRRMLVQGRKLLQRGTGLR
jgi:hypothetical protein